MTSLSRRLRLPLWLAAAGAIVLSLNSAPRAQPSAEAGGNLALRLDGYGDWVELPARVYDDLTEATVEAWVRWDAFGRYAQWFHYGRFFGLNHRESSRRLQLFLYDGLYDGPGGSLRLASIDTDLPTSTWHHMAAVTGPRGMKLYVDGVPVAGHPFTGSFANAAGPEFWLGRPGWVDNSYFTGHLDEVRVWSVARTQAQIRETMFGPVPAGAGHLVGYWNFDAGTPGDLSGFGRDGVLHGDAALVPATLPDRVPPARVLSGRITDRDGAPPIGGRIEIWRDGGIVAQARTGADGRFRFGLFGEGPCDLRATAGDRGTWVRLPAETQGVRHLDIVLPPASRLAGTVRDLGGEPVADVVVDALLVGWPVPAEAASPVATTFADEHGQYRFDNLRPGTYRVRCHVDGGFAWFGEQPPEDVRLTPSTRREGVDFRISPPLRGAWRAFDALDGFAGGEVLNVVQRADGTLWLATKLDGLWTFDGERFQQLTTADGLAHDAVRGLFEDGDGSLWIGTGAGVSRRVGDRFVDVDCAPLDRVQVNDLHRDRSGRLWIATDGDGLWRYDDGCHGRISTADGLAGDVVRRIFEAADGTLWFATTLGVSRLDGDRLLRFDNARLPARYVLDIDQSRNGDIWFATDRGAARFDGRRVSALPRQPVDRVFSLLVDRRDHVWFTTPTGVLRYDGASFARMSAAGERDLTFLRNITQTAEGSLWFTNLVYEPEAVVSFGRAAGLRGSQVTAIHPDGGTGLWIGTDRGVERFDGRRFVAHEDPDPSLSGLRVHDVEVDAEQTVWVGTDRGAWRLAGDGWQSVPVGAGVTVVHDIERGRDDTLWFATDSGVATYAAGRFRVSALAGGTFQVLQPDPRAGLWVGAIDVGLHHLHGGSFSQWLGPTTLRTFSGLAAGRGGELWAATANGVIRFDTGPEWPVPIGQLPRTVFASRDGLILGGVTDLAYRNGRLYCATRAGGVAIFDGTTWSALDGRGGLPGNRANALAFDPGGDLWIGMQDALVRYRPGSARPGVRVLSVRTDTLQSRRDTVTVAVGTRATIEYRAVDFRTPVDQRLYRYRVRTAGRAARPDSGWGQAGRADRAEWTPRRPGSWVFEVQAIDRDLAYSDPATVVLDVFLPWYDNAWLTVPGSAALALLLAGISGRTVRQRVEAGRLRQRMLAQEHEARLRLEAHNEQLERARREAESANTAKSAFLANMSHEIRTPMNAILGYTQILRQRQDLDVDVRRGLESIETSGDHLLTLINDVLDLSKIEAGRLERQDADFDLVALVGALSSMFQLSCRRRRLNWCVEWRRAAGTASAGRGEPAQPPALLAVYGDEGKLRQVLINLLSNAVKFTDRGDVTLRIVLPAAPEGRCGFEVVDTGRGIGAEDRRAIFEPFTQVEDVGRTEGTGLGLAIALRHVELMGGRLQLESEPGQGARFSFDLSLPPAARPLADAAGAPRRIVGLADGCRVRALVVDDLAENRDILRQLLTAVGVDVDTADSGREAVERVDAQPPDIVLLDIWMPGMDGLEAARRIRQRHGPTRPRLVAVSASVLDHERQRYLAAGFDDFIPKPVPAPKLYDALASLLHVEFEHRDEDGGFDARLVQLPDELIQGLRQAAEVGQLTRLEALLDDVRVHGDQAAALADHLRSLSRAIDIDRILEVLDDLTPTSSRTRSEEGKP